MDTTEQLIAGYTAYTDAEEIGVPVEGEAPATTPTLSTAVCASAVSVTVATWYYGC
ncbi:hypothetical protein SAMN05421833_11279 [Microbispora rosea]|uniref:Uncharacterized protein n=1 Tax=Microbispora rosea TaxID=58117 RepID=A0A1N7CMP4_9ACTN|nr:LxmA leader domain family RiPP [Microbispora rosea]GIH46376.1 hypothetical protein Mro03_15550 [Microbispora rosea subsp. rosea]SIR64717.1 hypothetical protein SAMN05421833_11279 [Microbispora rosea]